MGLLKFSIPCHPSKNDLFLIPYIIQPPICTDGSLLADFYTRAKGLGPTKHKS